MKVLVAGATGFIGKQVLLLLRESGHEIRVLTRNCETAGVRLPIACKVFAWDPLIGEPPAEAFKDVDAILNLAGENIAGGLWTKTRMSRILQSRVLSVRHLVEAIRKLDSPPKVFVSASAIGIYGDRGSESLTESSAPGTGPLAEVCKSWEKEIFRAATLNVRTVALRFGIVLGKNGGVMEKILPPVRLGLGGRLGDGKQWMSWTHVRDVAGLVLHALENNAVMGTLNAVSPHPVTNREFTDTLAKELRRPAILPVPALVLKTLLGEMSSLLLDSQKVTSKRANTYKFLYPRLNLALREVCNDFNHELLTEQWVPAPVDKVFPFFSDSKNLEILTPDFMGFQIVGQSTEKIEKGTRIDYQLKLHGIPFRWQSQIVDWQPNMKFADTQTRGPYSHWFHQHEFIPKDGGTLMRDRVSYAVPFGALGVLPIHPFVQRNLEQVFMYRRKKVEELFGEF
jgi:uncharacterized protein (TIGR01777 family)